VEPTIRLSQSDTPSQLGSENIIFMSTVIVGKPLKPTMALAACNVVSLLRILTNGTLADAWSMEGGERTQ
jgi:hypothetical protein